MKVPFERATASDNPILILGQTSGERELIARTIHANSPRADRPFMRIPYGALPPVLLASELFGAMPGTPSSRIHRGLFEMVAGGTLFVDQITRCSADIQTRVIRALTHREIVHVGARESIAVDVRLIAGTDQDLQREVEAGRFDRDLYELISFITIRVPAAVDAR
jgi:DNA-binding NtrC family response regulator